MSLAVHQGHAFLAQGEGGLRVVDVRDPAHLVTVAEEHRPVQTTFDVAVADSQVVTVGMQPGQDGETGWLQVHHFSAPGSLEPLGKVTFGGPVQSVALRGRYAWVVVEEAALRVVDIADPMHPAVVGRFGGLNSDQFLRITFSGDHAYIADDERGLMIFEATDPTPPRLVSAYRSSGRATEVAVAGDRAYLADGEAGLQIIDISNPEAPRRLGGDYVGGEARSVALYGGLVVLAVIHEDGSRLQLMDVSDVRAPRRVGSLPLPGDATRVTVSGHQAFVSTYRSGLQVVDLRTPAEPQISAGDVLGHHTRGVAMAEGQVLLADGEAGVQVLEESSGGFRWLRRHAWASPAWHIATTATHAFVARGENGILVLDHRHSQSIGPVGRLDTPGSAQRITLAGNHAYVADAQGGMLILDISDPNDLRTVSTYLTAGSVQSIAVAENLAVAADQFTGIHVLDISRPREVQRLGNFPASALDVALAGSHAFVAANLAGLLVLDLSLPGQPRSVGRLILGGNARSIKLAGSLALVGNGYGGLQVVDIRNPAQPRWVGSNSNLEAIEMYVTEGRLFVASGLRGLQVASVPPLLELEPGTASVILTGIAGQRVRLQRSPDLRIWNEAGSRTLGIRPEVWRDDRANLDEARYIRALIP